MTISVTVISVLRVSGDGIKTISVVVVFIADGMTTSVVMVWQHQW